MTESNLRLMMPLVGVILGALIGATASFFAGYFADKRKRRIDMIRLRLEKLEDASYALREIFDACVHLTTTGLMKTLWNNEMPTRTPEFKEALAKASTLISLYFPEARPAHQEFVDKKGELASVLVELHSVYDGTEPGFDNLSQDQKRKAAEFIAQKADALLQAVHGLETELERIAIELTCV